MPVILPPIQRRQFLKATVAVAAFVPNLVTAAVPERDVWAFLSDTHISADKKKTGGQESVNPWEHLVQIRADVLSGEIGVPRAVLVCGDCSFLQGLPEDYKTLFEEFTPFRKAGLPVHFIMGNHDHRQNFLNALAAKNGKSKPEKIPDQLYSVVETPKANFFLMDSLEKTNLSSGRFGEKQLQWLTSELDVRKDRPALIFAHHYPDFTGGILKNYHALQNTRSFFDHIAPRSQVKAFVFGHSHVWRIHKYNGIHLVNLPSTAWRFDSTQPYAWVSATLKDDGMTLRLRSIDKEHPRHNEIVELKWR